MPLENQVASLELSKKLKELGVKQKSLFWWGRVSGDGWALYHLNKLQSDNVSAFTVAELGEMLPKGYWDEVSVNGGFEIGYGQGRPMGDQKIDRYFVVEQNEAEARAKMLIYLLENNLITL